MPMDKDEAKARACARIDARADDISAISQHILQRPESGYKEYKTASYVAGWYDKLGIPYRDGLALTGIKGYLRGGMDGPTVAILGELDSLIIPEHPYADPATGAAHACGHNAQPASMLGAAIGLQEVAEELCGNVVLFAVPAEECIEVDWRSRQRDEGKIEFLVGKAELVRLGEFDDVQIAMLAHTQTGDGTQASVGDTHNGAIIKQAVFSGRSAHAGGAPWLGINALKAATLALAGIDAQRETFRESATIRVHPIITKGGDALTAVPADVRMEMLVRAKTLSDIEESAAKVDRALRAGALAIGADVEITSTPAYLPSAQDERLAAITEGNCRQLVGAANMGRPGHRTGSTDMGDLSHVMPVVQPRCGGAQGSPHSKDYYVVDHGLAAVVPAKYMAMTVIDLLWEDAHAAKEVISSAASRTMTVNEYLHLRRSLDQHVVFPGGEYSDRQGG